MRPRAAQLSSGKQTDLVAVTVIELWKRLLVPLQGEIGDQELERLSNVVLARIASQEIEALIIDTSGMWMVDSHLCAGLGRLATAASIMGVPSILCGLSADIVMTLQAMGFELDTLRTTLTLEAALSVSGIEVRRSTHPGVTS